MPELPEVYTITKQLNEVLPGKEIAKVELLREKSFQGQSLKVVGKKIFRVERKGKVMAIKLQAPGYLLVHLKMTGQLIFQPEAEKVRGTKYEVRGSRKEQRTTNYELRTTRIAGGHPTKDWVGELPSKHTRVIITFSDGSKLYFNDQRVFGWIRVATRDEWYGVRGRMPPDVIDPEFTPQYLIDVFKRSRRPVKLMVMDSSVIGGAGNIYANDALYLAKINPNTPACQVKHDAVIKLHAALLRVINRGIETGGASMKDYVDSSGMGGSYQDEFVVYGREGEACPTCGTTIEKIKLGGRGTYFCPKCQR